MLFALLALIAAPACESPGADDSERAREAEPDTTANSSTQETAAARGEQHNLARPKSEWVGERVRRAEKRLKDSRAGSLLWKSIEHHGGLSTWYENGPVYFHYNYQPLGDRGPRNTYQTVDTWAARARHQMAEDKDREYGWDGEIAWKKPADWKPPYDVRFWALTPYYFVGMPFVLADPGVDLEHEGTDTLEGESYQLVRATFGEDVGISPDDFYVLYIHEKTHRLGALRYVVSYEKFFPEGGHSPETLMTYDGSRTVDGIKFSEKSRFYDWDPQNKTQAEKVTDVTLSDVEFRPDTPDDYFEVPEGAAVIEPESDSEDESEE